MSVANIVVAAPDKASLTAQAYPAFSAAGLAIQALASSPRELEEAVTILGDVIVVIDVSLYDRPSPAAQDLEKLGVPVIVIVPGIWENEVNIFSGLSNLVKGHTAPVTWAEIVADVKAWLAQRSKSPDSSPQERQEDGEAASTSASHTRGGESSVKSPRSRGGASPSRRASTRLGFYGSRGGVGVSTAALTAAQALAEAGQRVALFDATRRGDLHVMLSQMPTEQPVQRGKITLFLSPPGEEQAQGFDAIIIDGGRERGNFNADWVELRRPLSDDQVRRLVGLETRRSASSRDRGRATQSGQRSKRRFRFGGLDLSKLIPVIEVTD
jgi:hypothetical protein